MIKIKSIKTGFSELSYAGHRTFSTIEEANLFFRKACLLCGEESKSYFKTDFIITWEDGETYKGRFDISENNKKNLSEHVNQFVKSTSASFKGFGDFLANHEI